MLMMVNPDAYRWISELAKDEAFQACISLSDKALQEQYDLELVTRFLVFRKLQEAELRSVGDIGEFLNDKVIEMAQSPDFDSVMNVEENAFKFTFEHFCEVLAERSFHRYDSQRGRHLGGFLISAV